MSDPGTESTLVLIKPDALKNSLTGYVLSTLSEFHTGLRFAALKVVQVSEMLAEEHYAEHRGKVFFPSLIEYITGRLHQVRNPQRRRVIAIVYQGVGAVARVREVCGPTNPHEAREKRPGSIRSLGTVVPLKDSSGKVIGERMDNLIHASATPAEAEREIKLWFAPTDLPPGMRPYTVGRCETHYYFADDRLFTGYAPGRHAILAPGATAWETDLAALEAIAAGRSAAVSLRSVAAKYLVNA